MVMFAILPVILLLVALGDIILRQDWQVKHLPKLMWVFIVILLPLVGSVLWFAIGREYGQLVQRGGFGDPRRWEVVAEPVPARRPTGSTEDQLKAIDAEIEYYENQARIQRLQKEVDARRKDDELTS